MNTSMAFYRDTLGFEIRNDVGYGRTRWIIVKIVARGQFPGLHVRLRARQSHRVDVTHDFQE